MTAYSISNQLPVFVDLDGKSVNFGKLYIGLPNQDPQTNPKTVYWDAAETDPVDQSDGISLIGGYIYNAGTPATLYINGNYSIRLRDRYGVQVWHFANINSQIQDLAAAIALRPTYVELAADNGASLIGFNRGVTGSIDTTGYGKYLARLDAMEFSSSWGTGDNTAAFQALLNEASASGRTAYLPPAIRAGAITVPTGVRVEPSGAQTTITTLAGSYDTFTLSSSDVELYGLLLENAAKTGGKDFLIACGTGTVRDIRVEEVLSRDSRGLIGDSGSGATGYHINTNFKNVHSERLNGPGVAMTRTFAYIFFRDVTADFVGVATGDFRGFDFDCSGMTAPDAGGILLEDCNVLGSASTYTTTVTNQRGFNIANLKAMQISRCTADGCGEYGWVLSHVNVLEADVVRGLLCANSGLYLDTVSNAVFTNVKASGRKGLAYAPATKDGIYFNGGCYDTVFTGGLVRDFTGNGINKATAQAGDVDFFGFRSCQNTGRGVYERGDSGFLYASGSLGANTAGNYDLGGAYAYIQSTQINSGAIVNVGPGPITG